MSHMHNPPYPGEVLADTVLRKDGGLTVSAFAAALGVSRVALSRVVNRRAGVSAELAIRLAAARPSRGSLCRPRTISRALRRSAAPASSA